MVARVQRGLRVASYADNAILENCGKWSKNAFLFADNEQSLVWF